VILYHVPKDISEKELLACMRKQNQDRLNEEDLAAIKFCFRTGRDYISVSRCYKCQGFGHVAKYCRVNYDIGAHCAESGHSTRQCCSKDKNASCVNCRKAWKKGDHAVSSVDCPMYKKALKLAVARTSYE
jgi:hypothetical protein